MNRKGLSTLAVVVGVVIIVSFGAAIARRSGFGAETWLMTAFALGIILVCQGPVIKLQQQVREIEIKMGGGDA
jgi:hypothetical protein